MQALATKYRPKTFDEVVGQENIITILRNQIKGESIRQVYLFTGGAGTGKTTTARIFANELDGEVIEIDGASNNSVDNIRQIIDSAKFAPIGKKYKVFIIDEVHMLSIGAFNALLKTLEEPPSHAVFIMATTDPQKIPATILSRVQRFDFKRVPTQQIIERLKTIIVYEYGNDLPIGEEVIEYIAKLAEGGMRDAISILDTCLGYKKDLKLEDVFEILGTTSYDAFFEIMNGILAQQPDKIIVTIEELHSEGKDLKQFIKELIQFVVDLNKIKIIGNYDYVTIPSAYHERVQKGMDYIIQNDIDLTKWFKRLSELSNAIRYENSPKTLIVGELICL